MTFYFVNHVLDLSSFELLVRGSLYGLNPIKTWILRSIIQIVDVARIFILQLAYNISIPTSSANF